MAIRTAYSAARQGRGYRFNTQRPTDEKKYWGNAFADERFVTVRKLSWKRDDGRSATTIRILPGNDSEVDGEWGPTRLSSDPYDFGDWIRCYTMCRLGEKAVTFMTHDPISDPDYNLYDNPGRLLWSGVKDAIKNGCERPGWGLLLDGSPGRAAVLVPPKPLHLVRCIVIEWANETIQVPQGLGPQDKIVLMDLGKGAGSKTTDLIEARVPGTEEDDEPSYVLPDPLAIDGGVFFRYFPVEQDPRNVRTGPVVPRTLASRAKPAAPAGKKDREEIGFGVYTLDELEDGLQPALKEFSASLLKKLPNWEDILVFHDNEAQARLLAPKFDLSLLDYCWRDHPDYLAIARDVHAHRGNVPIDVQEPEKAPVRRTLGQTAAAAEEAQEPSHPGSVPSELPSQRPWSPPEPVADAPVGPAAVMQAAAALTAEQREALAKGEVLPDAAAIETKRNKLDEAKARYAQRSMKSA